MIVGLMSQPMRAKYCVKYLDTVQEPAVVVVPSATVFDETPLGEHVRVVELASTARRAPSDKLVGGRVGRRVGALRDSGGRFGQTLFRAARRLQWKLRYLDRAAIIVRSSEAPVTERTAQLEQCLADIGSTAQIDTIVVFDLFDLPAALSYRQRHPGATVLVR